ncbi:MAG: hypothetical protein F6J87_07225, partial [Spirulina sp. SIO3F2]|nr:hypothetical protein [Spirulina sp. SIO3F2]
MGSQSSLTLGFQAELNLGDKQIPLLLFFSSKGLELVVQGQRFKFNSISDSTQQFQGFTATYNNNDKPLDLVDVLNEFFPAKLAQAIPTGLNIPLKQVFIAYQKATPSEASLIFLIGSTLDFSINLADLPLVGEQLPSDATYQLQNCQLLYSANPVSPAQQKLLPDDLAQCITTEPETPLASGFYLSTQLVFADQTQTLT